MKERNSDRVETHHILRLEVRKYINDRILRITMAMVCTTSKMRVDYRSSILDMDMREHADT